MTRRGELSLFCRVSNVFLIFVIDPLLLTNERPFLLLWKRGGNAFDGS